MNILCSASFSLLIKHKKNPKLVEKKYQNTFGLETIIVLIQISRDIINLQTFIFTLHKIKPRQFKCDMMFRIKNFLKTFKCDTTLFIYIIFEFFKSKFNMIFQIHVLDISL